jgi:Phosphotransferase system cellobiose-specific component IIC
MPDGVPPAVSDSFSSLIPASVVFIIFGVIAVVLGFNLNTFMSTLMSPVSNLLKTPWGYALYHSLMGLVFFCGINSAVVCDVAYPFLLANGIANEKAIRAGGAAIYGATYGTDVLIWAGGTGATIGLMILMSFVAKSKYFKTLGRMSIGPGIFNINEPIIFGTPICFNPIFLFPFVVLPGILAGSTILLMETGIIAMPTVSMVPWTTPPILIGFLMTSGALSTTIWSVLVIVISVIVYYPFFRVADKQQYEKELSESQEVLSEEIIE